MELLKLDLAPQQPERRPLDKYRTPSWVTAALIESYPEVRGELIFDPSAGDCRMPRALIDAGRFNECRTNDLDENEPTDTHLDACDALSADYRGTTWWVTNPPFLEAGRIAWYIISELLTRRGIRGGLALLLRATWLEPTEDRQWLGRFPPRAELVLPRFGFIGGSASDSAGCRWLLWGDVEPGIKVWVGKPGQGELFNAH